MSSRSADNLCVLGIETSCDDTAAAVLRGRDLLASVISSQHDIHGPYGGVVPELASRQHMVNILPVIDRALATARVSLDDVQGVAVTFTPGLIGSLLVGLSTAKGIAAARGIPLVGVNHLEGHLLAVLLGGGAEVAFPFLALLVSGGHSCLYLVEDLGAYRYLGGTRDDAAGEAFDKVANMMGLGYPGGPAIDAVARRGDGRAVRFPRARLKQGSYDLSFSGLKTAVRVFLQANPGWKEQVEDVAASFQDAVVDMLLAPTLRAARDLGIKRLVLTGGVSANSRLRDRAAAECRETGLAVFSPPPELCTDNAAMIAFAGAWRLERGQRSLLSLRAVAAGLRP